MQSSELLRRSTEDAAKLQSARPLKDASLRTQMIRFGNTVVGRAKNGGQQLVRSSEVVVSARAACSICEAPVQQTYEIGCCEPEPRVTVPATGLRGTDRGCCRVDLPPVVSNTCCPDPALRNTYKANGIVPGLVPILSSCCPPPGQPCITPCMECPLPE